MTAPKRKCCELAEDDAKKWSERWLGIRNGGAIADNLLMKIETAEAHLRYCRAANDKTEETE